MTIQLDVESTGEATGAQADESGAHGRAAAALEALGEAVFLCDPLGRVSYANPVLLARLGRSAESAPDLIGRHWGGLFEAESRRRIEREALPALHEGGRWRGRVRLAAGAGPDGDAPAQQLALSQLAGGGLVGLLLREGGDAAGAAERGGLVEAADARRERMDSLRRLAGDMAHDLNNVLATIVGYARFLTEDLPKDGQPHGFAQQILVATERAKRLVDGALAFSRPDKAERKTVTVAPVVEQTARALRGRLPAGSTLRIRGGGPDLAVEAAPAVFAGAVEQLLANAEEALAGRAGTVEVAWRATGDLRQLPGLARPGAPARVVIEHLEAGRLLAAAGAPDPNSRFLELSVHDSGHGIAPEVMEHVFEPFFTTRQPSKGRGLGLSMVYGQVVGQGGAILIDSGPADGTTVRLFWPAAPGVEAVSKTEAGAKPGAAAAVAAGGAGTPGRRPLPKGRGQRVLVAEDDRVLREAIGEMLQRLNYKPVLVNDGEVARRVLSEGGAIEAVMTDRRMPNLSGTELIEWMRGQGLAQPVLLCTGYGEDLDTAGLSRAGGVAVLSKPIDAATLAGRLDALLRAQAG